MAQFNSKILSGPPSWEEAEKEEALRCGEVMRRCDELAHARMCARMSAVSLACPYLPQLLTHLVCEFGGEFLQILYKSRMERWENNGGVSDEDVRNDIVARAASKNKAVGIGGLITF